MIYIDGYPIDLAVSEAPTFASTVTKHPVEDGTEFSDHISNEPAELTLECIVSDTPIGDIANDPTRLPDGLDVALPAEDAYARLQAIRAARQPIPVETSFGEMKMMAMTMLSPKKDPKTTGGLFFSVTLQEVVVKQIRRVSVNVAPIAKPPADGGKKKGKKLDGVERMVDKYDQTWNDPDINAWREGAYFEGGRWHYQKGTPLGYPPNLTDAQYRELIAQRNGGLIKIANKNGTPGVTPKDRATGNYEINKGQQFVTDPDEIKAAEERQNAIDNGYIPLDAPPNTYPGQSSFTSGLGPGR